MLSASSMPLTDGEREGQRAFARLRHLCTQLLEASSTSSEERGIVLDALQRVLRNIDPPGLQRCMDYVLFPLLLLLDWAVSSRTSSLKDKHALKTQTSLVSDRVSESVLSCVEIVLQRCTLETQEQMIMMLRKLTGAAMLSASEAAEEFRLAVVKCLKALLENLKSCNSASCACQSVSVSPFETFKQKTWNLAEVMKGDSYEVEISTDETDTCPLGLLQTESMAPAVGHLISLLLQIAEAEAGRGGLGSGRLRRDALSTLRLLVLKVGSADALAYFLPGAVRGFASAMRFTKAQVNSGFSTPIVHVSGAAGWPPVIEEAVRGMAEILSIVLGDKVNESKSTDSITNTAEPATLGAALDYLQDFSMQLRKNDKDGLATPGTDQPETRPSTLVVHEKQNHERATGVVEAEVCSLRIERSRKWLSETATNVHTFLSQTLPLLCAHQSPSVRLAVAEAATVLIVNCESTLESCNSPLLECLLALACDEFEHVASAAQTFLSRLMGFRGSVWSDNATGGLVDQDEDSVMFFKLRRIMTALLSRWRFNRLNISNRLIVSASQILMERVDDRHELFSCTSTLERQNQIKVSLLEQLPKVIFSANTAMAVSHGRRLAAAMYFSGPEGVSSCLLGTPIDRQRLITIFKQCLSFNSAFTGSLGQISSSQTAYYPMVSQILPVEGTHIEHNLPEQESDERGGLIQKSDASGIPSMPPWLPVGTGSRLYRVLGDVLRLVGVSAVSDQRNGITLFGLVELLLEDVRLAASNRNMYKSSSVFVDFESGQKQRAAATSACVLNEIIFGASGKWNYDIFDQFLEEDSSKELEEKATEVTSTDRDNHGGDPAELTSLLDEKGAKDEAKENRDVQSMNGRWQGAKKDFVKRILTECAGDVIHDYMSTQIWDEPTYLTESSPTSRVLSSSSEYQDVAMLQKVLIEGIGVLGLALGKQFEESGLLRLVLFPLLEKLASSNYYVSQAAAMSLKAICYCCQYPTVKDLVVANLDNVVDFLCRQFRHLNMHPQSLNLLAAILRHTNTAPDLLPLLGEPLHCVVMELDVIARTSRPHLTVPLLRAMREILRAARSEVDGMLTKAKTAAAYWTSLTEVENTTESADGVYHANRIQKIFEDTEIEELVDGHLDRIRQRQAVAKVATSCLAASGPLLASKNPQTCLLTLDVIEDGINTLADAEDSRRYEDTCRQVLKDYSTRMQDPQSSMPWVDAINRDESETNKLLPTMHRIWPYLVACLRQSRTSVVIRALEVMAVVTTKCGGEFFTRRLKNDIVPILVGLLSKGLPSVPIKRRSHPLVPVGYSQAPEQGPTAILNTQLAVLKSITSIAGDKKSASALRSAFEVIASWVVALACQVEPLRVAATDAVLALSTIDSDFVWILVADMISGAVNGEYSEVTLPGFPDFTKILPAWSSQADALWCQYTNYRGEFRDVDRIAAQHLLAKLEGSPTTRR